MIMRQKAPFQPPRCSVQNLPNWKANGRISLLKLLHERCLLRCCFKGRYTCYMWAITVPKVQQLTPLVTRAVEHRFDISGTVGYTARMTSNRLRLIHRKKKLVHAVQTYLMEPYSTSSQSNQLDHASKVNVIIMK